jgi:ubiquilin
MEQIEVNIKLESNNKIYNIPIRKLDTVLKLKEYCQILSEIPPAQQNLLYKGKLLSDEKFINDYNIKNNDNIILVKKEEIMIINSPKEFYNKNEICFPINEEINYNEIANAARQIPDITSYFNKMDLNKLDNYYKSMGYGSFSYFFGCEPQEFKELLKDPSFRDIMNTILKDPSLLEISLNNPKLKNKIQNNQYLKFCIQNLPIGLSPHNLQKEQNMFKEDEININESSTISVPQEPFGSLSNIQMMNSSSQISNINTFNNDNTGNKGIIENNEININYKEKYKEQLSKLKNMGFINEKANILALIHSNGNINNALEELLKLN